LKIYQKTQPTFNKKYRVYPSEKIIFRPLNKSTNI
jgi:hypothetical protein